MKRFLLWELIALQLTIISIVVAVMYFAMQRLAADHFMTLVEQYEIPKEAAYGLYMKSVNMYLISAGYLGGFLGFIISFLVIRQILRPVAHLSAAAERITAGDFTARVTPAKRGEFANVTNTFNQMAKSLQESDELRKSLVRNAAHELRTPLTNIRGYLEALHDNIVPPTAETFTMLHNESLRLVYLVDDLVRLARADAAKSNLHKEEVQLGELLNQTLRLFNVRIKNKQLRMTGNIESFHQVVSVDQGRVIQIITNILDNACRYSPEGGEINILSTTNENHVKVVISNTSKTIPQEELPLLFERFYRVDKSRSRQSGGGAGIGLAIVKELVESHGGQIGIESIDSTISVWFTIPL